MFFRQAYSVSVWLLSWLYFIHLTAVFVLSLLHAIVFFFKFFFTIYVQLHFVICILYNKWMNTQTVYIPFWRRENVGVDSGHSKVNDRHKNSNQTDGCQHWRLPVPHLPIHNTTVHQILGRYSAVDTKTRCLQAYKALNGQVLQHYQDFVFCQLSMTVEHVWDQHKIAILLFLA